MSNVTYNMSLSHLSHVVIVQPVAQSKMDRAEWPCERSEHYHYGDCVLAKISTNVGCQTFTTNISNIPKCSTYQQYLDFFHESTVFLNSEAKDLLKKSNCPWPCRYMEYKVILFLLHLNVVTSLQLAGPPVYVPLSGQNMTMMTVVFATSAVLMEKEEEAFSFESLVADIGGVLGLFIGFNFLILWEFLIVLMKKVPYQCKMFHFQH